MLLGKLFCILSTLAVIASPVVCECYQDPVNKDLAPRGLCCQRSDGSPKIADVETALDDLYKKDNWYCQGSIVGSKCKQMTKNGSGKINICGYDWKGSSRPYCPQVAALAEVVLRQCGAEGIVGGKITTGIYEVSISHMWAVGLNRESIGLVKIGFISKAFNFYITTSHLCNYIQRKKKRRRVYNESYKATTHNCRLEEI